VSSSADVSRWAPLDHALHRVLWQPMPCRPCAHRVCPYEHGCATAITASQVVRTLPFATASAASAAPFEMSLLKATT